MYPRPVVIPNKLFTTLLSVHNISEIVMWLIGKKRTWSCPADKGKGTQPGEYISRKPVPAKAANKDVQEELIPGNSPAIGYRICATVQSLEQGCIGQGRRPNLVVVNDGHSSDMVRFKLPYAVALLYICMIVPQGQARTSAWTKLARFGIRRESACPDTLFVPV